MVRLSPERIISYLENVLVQILADHATSRFKVQEITIPRSFIFAHMVANKNSQLIWYVWELRLRADREIASPPLGKPPQYSGKYAGHWLRKLPTETLDGGPGLNNFPVLRLQSRILPPSGNLQRWRRVGNERLIAGADGGLHMASVRARPSASPADSRRAVLGLGGLGGGLGR